MPKRLDRNLKTPAGEDGDRVRELLSSARNIREQATGIDLKFVAYLAGLLELELEREVKNRGGSAEVVKFR